MDYGNLIIQINRSYPINIKHIELHREMIGKVYFLQSQDRRYTLKIYRSFKTDDALQTICILDYLKENSYPAVSIIRTEQNESHIILSSQDGCCVGILYDYVEGAMPDGKIEAESIGIQIGQLHNLMDKYPDKLKNRPKTEYVDDYISIMRELDFHSEKTLELEQYGNLLWGRITKLQKKFCHGDLHTGNMIRNQSGEYVLLDFDDASGDYPSMDVAYMSDDTNFNHFHESMYDQTIRLCERFYSGYSKVSVLSNNEIHAILDFIAIRHFLIISRIVRCQGMQSVSKEFCDEQYFWLMKWQELCAKKQH
ncbi:phosphotransferase enzyme family protein [Paenibacillus sp. FSL K6-2859]|uniref:phosphotransferase enzyme family protein n=1 Tax=Paenibacillus sp. FSL K6-2859 TaxID=2921482 RepID=UPI0030F55E77